ncbi:MAG TPA: Gfo/Idh/MocA family oxidoreductase, partial [Ktedonobacteraceae bacterium]|nr:Gfo/Idh/MocA family oxidoreductase [Ktedonobacteraceae bacterium]
MLKDPLVVTTRESLRNLDTEKVVILNGDIGPISTEQEFELYSFIERGGGLVCLGDAAEAYREYPLLGEILGHIHGLCTQRSEIIARVATADHYLTRRMDSSFIVHEGVYVLNIVPTDAVILWQVSWHYATYTVAYVREFGQGRVFCTTLGSDPQTQILPAFQQLLFRAISFAAGAETREQTKRVAMVGYGAIGFEHGTAINHVTGLEYALVCDRNEERLAIARQAFPGVSTCIDLRDVEEDPNIDVVIVSTPPDTHAAISKQMLLAGKHVVSEKPFCLTTAEADELIQLAQDHQRALTVYQCRRWDPDFMAIQEVLKCET